jgi:hypothetical protein
MVSGQQQFVGELFEVTPAGHSLYEFFATDAGRLIGRTLGEVRRLLAHLIIKVPAVLPSGPGPAGAAATSTAPERVTASENMLSNEVLLKYLQ